MAVLTDSEWGQRRRPGGSRAGKWNRARRARFDEVIGVHAPALDVIARRLCRVSP
jgi:hypothetical protein